MRIRDFLSVLAPEQGVEILEYNEKSGLGEIQLFKGEAADVPWTIVDMDIDVEDRFCGFISVVDHDFLQIYIKEEKKHVVYKPELLEF